MSIFKSIMAKIFPSSSHDESVARKPQSSPGIEVGGSPDTSAAQTGGRAPANDPMTGERSADSMPPAAPAGTTPAGTQAQGASATGATSPTPVGTGTPAAPATQTPNMSSPAVQTTDQASVDVEAVLAGMESQQSQQLNWRTSIVDLLKLLGLDSSLEARKELARELHYTGSTDDSAAMNVWLHKEVMRRLQENGGRLPSELR